mmetsp:Transcript_15330/g.23134  ORF Transcript_15330/g.23134 Transcript_15330/m.23134 type:complete len:81 (-) Transcript_15330:3355-3597(-)
MLESYHTCLAWISFISTISLKNLRKHYLLPLTAEKSVIYGKGQIVYTMQFNKLWNILTMEGVTGERKYELASSHEDDKSR